MIFVTGGAFQGKRRFVTETLGISEERALFDAHEYVEAVLSEGRDPEAELMRMICGGAVDAVTADEIGMGIVPQDADERRRREITGRIMCKIAERSDEVYRLVCGIPVKIKQG